MRNILLLGAGFSKNWGGLLAKEFLAELINDPEIRNDAEIKNLLWLYPGNFEKALETLQLARATDSEQLYRLEMAISRLFGKMNDVLKHREFFLREADNTLNGARRPNLFLSRFNKIFTLNQDLLLEYHHFGQPQFMQDSWSGGRLPGLTCNGQPDDPKQFANGTWVVNGALDVPDIYQPLYKLHGSVNWSGDGMMIMGTGKAAAIKAIDLLAKYQDIFVRTLQAPNTRLTVIGYSFADKHINETIEAAVRHHNLKLFVIDPNWTNIAYSDSKDFRDWFVQGVQTGSSLSLLYLLRDESLDRQRLDGFLTGK